MVAVRVPSTSSRIDERAPGPWSRPGAARVVRSGVTEMPVLASGMSSGRCSLSTFLADALLGDFAIVEREPRLLR
jgi:hypothetical protein